MQDVNIYIETSFHGPARKDGEYLYLLECIRNGAPATRAVSYTHLDVYKRQTLSFSYNSSSYG